MKELEKAKTLKEVYGDEIPTKNAEQTAADCCVVSAEGFLLTVLGSEALTAPAKKQKIQGMLKKMRAPPVSVAAACSEDVAPHYFRRVITAPSAEVVACLGASGAFVTSRHPHCLELNHKYGFSWQVTRSPVLLRQFLHSTRETGHYVYRGWKQKAPSRSL